MIPQLNQLKQNEEGWLEWFLKSIIFIPVIIFIFIFSVVILLGRKILNKT